MIVAKCTKCGHQQLVDRPAYSSPIVQCQACGAHFYEEKIREAALFPPPIQTAYWDGYNFFLYSLIIVICVLFLAFPKKIDRFYWQLLFLLPLIILFLFWKISFPYIKERRYKVRYEQAIAQSRQRLRSKAYQDQLLQASGNNKELAEALERYIRQNSLVLQDGQYVPRQH